MEIIKEVDREWFGYGVTAGINIRKRVSPNSNKIINYGKQGVKIIPTYKQIVSLCIGYEFGKRMIVQNLNNIKPTTTQGHKPYMSKGECLTLEIAEKEAERGQTILLPFFISNNRVDNRGVAGFRLKFTYNTDYLDLISITPSSIWDGSFEYQHDAGVVLVQGFRNYAGFADMILGFIEFYVKETAQTKNIIDVKNSLGTGEASELYTYIGDDLWFIKPKKEKDGLITLEPIEQEQKEVHKIEVAGSPVLVGDGNSYATYYFSATMGNSGGVGGCSAWVNVYLDGKLIGQKRIDLIEGDHTYTGNVPIRLPSISTGNISYEIVTEANNPEEQGFYYVFIRAGQIFTLNSEIPRENVNELGNVEMLENLYTVTRTYCEAEFVLERVSVPLDLTELITKTETSSSTIFELVKEEKLDLSELKTIIDILCSTDYVIE